MNDWDAATDFDFLDQCNLETLDNLQEPRLHRRKPKQRRNLLAVKKEKLEEFFTRLPEPGESIHMVSNGSFDYWNFCPTVIDLMRTPAAEFYGSTWTLNRANCVEMFELFDAGKIQKITMLTGIYLKRRETAIYTPMAEGLIQRKQRLLCFENHAKIMLISNGKEFIVIEGSANFTANPRLEQNVISNDQDLYQFHRDWMEYLLVNASGKRVYKNV